ncbi:MAG: divalent-cation tolerance protein CutA [Sphingomonadaceae bacterium]
MTPIVSVYVTFPSAADAETIGSAMVEAGLAACVNILARCRSVYRWQGRIEAAEEVPAIFKTTEERAERLIAAIAEAHPYEVPAITAWPVGQALGTYADWVRQETDERA